MNEMTPIQTEQAIDFSEIDFPVEKRPLYYMRSQEMPGLWNKTQESFHRVPGKWEVVREDTGAHLAVVGKHHNPSNYVEGAEAFVQAINELKINGSLDTTEMDFQVQSFEDGRKMKIEVRLPNHTIEPVVGDVSELQLHLFDSHDQFWVRQAVQIALRYWCSNGCASPSFSLGYKGKHTKSLSQQESLDRMMRSISRSVQQFHENEELFEKWANTRVTEEETLDVFAKSIAAYRNAKGVMEVSKPVMQDLEAALYQNTRAIGKNAWAAYNAATEWATHIGKTKGQVYNVQRDRNSKVAKMLRGAQWKTLTGENND